MKNFRVKKQGFLYMKNIDSENISLFSLKSLKGFGL